MKYMPMQYCYYEVEQTALVAVVIVSCSVFLQQL